MVCQVAAHGRDRHVSLVDGFEVGAPFSAKSAANFTDPVIRLAARIDQFADNEPGLFESLLGYLDPLWLADRYINVKQSLIREALGYGTFGDLSSDPHCLAKIAAGTGRKAESKPRNAKDSGFHPTCTRAGVCRVVSEIRAVVDTRYTYLRQLGRR